MTADNVCLAAYPKAEWDRVTAEAELLTRSFNQPAASLVRLGDGELNLLRRGDSDVIARELRRAANEATVLGLPEHFTGQVHSWRTALQGELDRSGSSGAPEPRGLSEEQAVISAVLPLYRPSVIARVAGGRRVLWVTHGASVIVRRLKVLEFCRFYGFEEGRADDALDTIAGRTLPAGIADPHAHAQQVCAEIGTRTFDLAIIGMGALGKLLVRYVSQEMQRPALDAGCILSAFRGDWGDRLVFQRELKELVWKAPL